MSRRRAALFSILAAGPAPFIMGQGCFPTFPSPYSGSPYNNTTDRTNGGSTYLGSAACKACHPNIDATQSLHGHGHMLNAIQGEPPKYPSSITRATVPNPPAGYTWNDIAYVIGGYERKANFIDQQGYLITTGFNHIDAQWNLDLDLNGTTSKFAPFQSDTTTRQPYDYACFSCHTTGARQQDPSSPQFQENRPGILGTWVEAGVQCEACHGPGSRHVPNPSARDNFVDSSAKFCGECHGRTDLATIPVSGGFIRNYSQYNELLASGAHAQFDCTFCHDPHASTEYDKTNGLRNTCTNCHTDMNMALHQNNTFVRGSYVEPLTCTSCHMPLASLSAAASGTDMAGPDGRVGDIRTHIFRINPDPVDYKTMFTADLSQVRKDGNGRAAVTVDFVCLRCHNDVGAFKLSVAQASEIAQVMHQVSR